MAKGSSSVNQRAYAAGWARARRQENTAVLRAIKLERGCIDCGYNAHPSALDFDHRNPAAKSFTISKAVTSRNVASLLIEVAKCDVRCANCHRIRSFQDRWGNHVVRPRPPKPPRPPKKVKPMGPGPARGTRNASAKLDEATVLLIRQLGASVVSGAQGRRPAGQMSWAALGRQFNISAIQARNIAQGSSWAHVDPGRGADV